MGRGYQSGRNRSNRIDDSNGEKYADVLLAQAWFESEKTRHPADDLGVVATRNVRRRALRTGPVLVAESGSSTDDRGEFRIFSVPPGDYVIVARFDATGLGSRDRVRYVPTYYPGTPVASEAQRVTVGLGQEVPGITIALARAATATVRGVVRSSGQASFGPFTFVNAHSDALQSVLREVALSEIGLVR